MDKFIKMTVDENENVFVLAKEIIAVCDWKANNSIVFTATKEFFVDETPEQILEAMGYAKEENE